MSFGSPFCHCSHPAVTKRVQTRSAPEAGNSAGSVDHRWRASFDIAGFPRPLDCLLIERAFSTVRSIYSSWRLAEPFREAREALGRLLRIARQDTGQARRVASFLFAWHNAEENGGWDRVDMWNVDAAIACDMLTVMRFIRDPSATRMV
jgi:hypothetical protein